MKTRPHPSLETPRTGMSLGLLPGGGHQPSSEPSAMAACAAQLERSAQTQAWRILFR